MKNVLVSLKIVVFICLFPLLSGCAVKEPRATVVPGLPDPPLQHPVRLLAPLVPDMVGAEGEFSSALEAFKKGDMELALIGAGQVTVHYPNTSRYKRALFLMEKAFIQLDREPEADAAMLRVQEEYPELADYAVFLLADYHFSKGRFTRAAALYQHLAERYPKSFLRTRALLKHGQALLESYAFLPAADVFEKFLQDYPQSDLAPEAGLGLGKAFIAEARLNEAVRAYLDVWMKYPGNSRDQEVEKALNDLKGGGVDVPALSPDELYTRARNLYKSGQYDKAFASFIAALEADPKHPQRADILVRSGIALYNLGRRPEAAQTLERFLREFTGDPRSAEALNWLGKAYSKMGEREKAVQTYLKIVDRFPESEWADDALYQTGNVFREANDTKKALKFYGRLAADFPDSPLADSALWWKAWASYTTGDYQRTVFTLQELVSRYPRSFLVTQARYWQGRAAEKLGNTPKAASYYQKALLHGPYTYYGYRAVERLSSIEAPALTVVAEAPNQESALHDAGLPPDDPLEAFDTGDQAGPPVWTEEAIRLLSSDPSFKKTLELMSLNMKTEAAAELWALQEKITPKHGALLGLSKAFFELGDYYRSLIIVLRNYDRFLDGPVRETPSDFWFLAYPQGYWDSVVTHARKYKQDPYFIAAIIREESQFHPEALSPAGARGVMQVMPLTGEWIARTIKASGFDRGKLFDSDTSITIGAWYVSRLMNRFKGDALLAAAAYNAGPEAVAGWLAKNGGRMERDEFVEAIPFTETRGYVKKVLRNYAEYKRIYGKDGQNPMLSPLPTAESLGSLSAVEEVKLP